MGYLSIGTSPSECARNVYIRNMRFTYVFLTIILGISISTISIFSPVPSSAQENITLNALLVEPRDRWEDVLIPMALQNLTAKHPELDIQVNYTILPVQRSQRSDAKGNGK